MDTRRPASGRPERQADGSADDNHDPEDGSAHPEQPDFLLADVEPAYLAPSPVPVGPIKRLGRKLPPRLRARMHSWIYDTPVVSELFSSRDSVMRIAHVTPQTALVMDGFPRSGNSYARSAFLLANRNDVNISTHGHSHRFVQRGVSLGLPVIVLIREPRAAIASLLQYEPSASVSRLAAAYVRYYRHVIPLLDSVVIGQFDEVTTDFGAVLRRCNDRFGSTLAIYQKSPEAEAAVHAHIDASTRIAVPLDRFDSVVPRAGFRNSDATSLSLVNRRTRARLDEAHLVYEDVLAHPARY
jgi:hypothetical protein